MTSLIDIIKSKFKDPGDISLALRFVHELSGLTQSKDAIRIAQANINQNKINMKIGEYTIKPSTDKFHIESVFQHEIIDKTGARIATFDFYSLPQTQNQSGPIIINLIQGVRGCENELMDFSQKVGTNWRVFLVQMLKEKCDTEGLTLIGRLPGRFEFVGRLSTTDAEYRRQLRQYIQAYLKGGIKLENIDALRVGEEIPRKWVEENLRTKQKRRIEKPKPKRPEIKRPRI